MFVDCISTKYAQIIDYVVFRHPINKPLYSIKNIIASSVNKWWLFRFCTTNTVLDPVSTPGYSMVFTYISSFEIISVPNFISFFQFVDKIHTSNSKPLGRSGLNFCLWLLTALVMFSILGSSSPLHSTGSCSTSSSTVFLALEYKSLIPLSFAYR